MEICNNKFYRVHAREDETTNNAISLRNIYRRTNELTVFECQTRNQELAVQPGEKKGLLPQRALMKPFKSLTEIKMGTILDAQDAYVSRG